MGSCLRDGLSALSVGVNVGVVPGISDFHNQSDVGPLIESRKSLDRFRQGLRKCLLQNEIETDWLWNGVMLLGEV